MRERHQALRSLDKSQSHYHPKLRRFGFTFPNVISFSLYDASFGLRTGCFARESSSPQFLLFTANSSSPPTLQILGSIGLLNFSIPVTLVSLIIRCVLKTFANLLFPSATSLLWFRQLLVNLDFVRRDKLSL